MTTYILLKSDAVKAEPERDTYILENDGGLPVKSDAVKAARRERHGRGRDYNDEDIDDEGDGENRKKERKRHKKSEKVREKSPDDKAPPKRRSVKSKMQRDR